MACLNQAAVSTDIVPFCRNLAFTSRRLVGAMMVAVVVESGPASSACTTTYLPTHPTNDNGWVHTIPQTHDKG